MDIKKEMGEESEMMNELVNDIKQLNENGNAEHKEEPAYSVNDTVENNIVKTELDTDMEFCDADVGYSFENYDIPLAVKPEEENNSDDTKLEIEKHSLKDEDLEAKGHDFVKMEADLELYQQSDDSLDIVGNDNNFFTLDYTERTEREFSRKSGSVACRSGTGLNGDKCDNDESDAELDYDNETDSYNEEDYEYKLDIVIKKEKAEFNEQEIDEGAAEERKVIDYGRKTKKAKNYVCCLCSKAFTSDNRLKRHKEHLHPDGVNEDRTYKEGKYLCEMDINSMDKSLVLDGLDTSIKIEHDDDNTAVSCEKPSSSAVVELPDGDSDKMYICETCSRRYKHKYSLSIHVKDKHDHIYKYMCPVCKKGFNQLYNYKGHLGSHGKEFQRNCPHCNETFKYHSSFLDHIKTKHKGEEFACSHDGCWKTFKTMRGLKDHDRVVHLNKDFPCKVCDKTYRWRSSLKYHVDRHHAQLQK